MARKSQYDQEVDAVRTRLCELSHKNAKTVEEAVNNEQTVCHAFGMKPAESEAYDYCPEHTVVRFRGQCHLCKD